MIATQAPTGCATVHWAMSGLRMPPRRRRRHPSSDRCHGNCPTHHPMPQSLPNLCPAGIAAQAAEPPVPGSSALCTDPACRRCTPDGSRCAECHGPDMAPTGPLQGLNASGACVRCNVAGEHADRCVRCDGDRPTVCLECVPYHHKFGSSGERGGGGGKILRHKRWSLTGTEPHLALARTTPLPPNLLLPGYYATPEGLCARCPDSECGNCSSLTGACTSCNRRWGAVDGVCRPCGESGGHPVGLGPLQLTGAVLLFSPIYLPRILPPRFRMPQPTQGASGVMVSASWLGSFTQRVFQDSCWTSI